MGRFLVLSAALLAASISPVLTAPVLIYCEDASHNVPGAHPPCTTVSPAKILDIPLPIQTSILMAFAPDVQFGVPSRLLKENDNDEDYDDAENADDAATKTKNPLPSFPTTLMPILDFLERASDSTDESTLSEPPHAPLSEGPFSIEEEDLTQQELSPNKNHLLHYLLFDLKTMPAAYIVFALVGVTLLAYVLGEACELCRSRLARSRRCSNRSGIFLSDRDEKTKL